METELDFDFSAIQQNDEAFLELKRTWNELRAETAENLSRSMKQAVDSEIESSGLNDQNGHVKSWQQSRIGSYGGYAAISPKSGGERGQNPGAITNYLEHSHKVRSPSGQAKRYNPRIKQMRTRAFRFYTNARRKLESEIKAEEQKIEKALEDGIKELFS